MMSDLESIKAFWTARAHSVDLPEDTVTHPDSNQRLLENELVLQYLPRWQRVLDVGCGNGFSTAIFARYASEIVGIDYSTAMIERAQSQFGHIGNITFQVQDVLDLKFPASSFDAAISQRCLINLGTWDRQQAAIANIARVLKPGGCFIMQEGTRQGREHLNRLREALGLPRMPEVKHNLDFDEDVLWVFLRQFFEIVETRRLGMYDLISRVVHPLLVAPEEPSYAARINKIAAQICAQFRGADEIAREFSVFLRRLEN